MPTAAANGLTLAYETSGAPDAPPVLLLMGLGMPLVFWPDAFVDGLAASGFRIVRFDNRDCGHSAKVRSGPLPSIPLAIGRSLLRLRVRAPYTLDDMAADAAGLLDALGVARAHLVGVSMGGMIAQVMAARHPQRVTSLTSIMSSSGNPRVSLGRMGVVRAMLRRPDDPNDVNAVIAHLVHLFGVIGSPGFATDAELLRRDCERVARRGYYPAGTARQLLAILASGDRRRDLARVRAPTLVIHGTHDPLLPPVAGRDTAAHIPGAKLMLIDGMGHDLPPALTARLVGAIAAHCRAAEG
ncbi:MAG TPA: alpha/beta fold hydrolase [Burkholderiales bacterium]|nr:alpha/beta fold hydrolase [Burkholderiales bacterium]